MNKKPTFYKNVSGSPMTSELSSGSSVFATNLPIIAEPIKQKVEVEVFGTFQKTIKHELKKKYDCFVRVREKETKPWRTLPSYTLSPFGGPASTIRVQNITDSDITLEFESIQPTTYEVEIYFIAFNI